MKKIFKALLFMLIVVVLSKCERDEPNIYVNIPDKNFLNELIARGVDINGDSIISTFEAKWLKILDLYDCSTIKDLTGIEAFINLEVLCCYYNQLTSLDVSNNIKLKYLDCSFNQLTNLDVSNNKALFILDCGINQLTSLDVSKTTALVDLTCYSNQLNSLNVSNNTALKELYCFSNLLTSLDVSKNTALWRLNCGRNQLTTLDISNNTALEALFIDEMPSLNKVCVWIMPFPPTGFGLETKSSPNVYFTTDCSK